MWQYLACGDRQWPLRRVAKVLPYSSKGSNLPSCAFSVKGGRVAVCSCAPPGGRRRSEGLSLLAAEALKRPRGKRTSHKPSEAKNLRSWASPGRHVGYLSKQAVCLVCRAGLQTCKVGYYIPLYIRALSQELVDGTILLVCDWPRALPVLVDD